MHEEVEGIARQTGAGGPIKHREVEEEEEDTSATEGETSTVTSYQVLMIGSFLDRGQGHKTEVREILVTQLEEKGQGHMTETEEIGQGHLTETEERIL